MRKLFLLPVLCLALYHLTCLGQDYDDNKVKIKNELSETLSLVRIGDLKYRDIAAGSTSKAERFNGGSYGLIATTESGIQYSGEVSFLGRFLDFLVVFRANGSIGVEKE